MSRLQMTYMQWTESAVQLTVFNRTATEREWCVLGRRPCNVLGPRPGLASPGGQLQIVR